MFDSYGALKKYESVDEIIREYYVTRLDCYVKRKEFLEGMLTAEAERLTAQARFILEKIDGTIVIGITLVLFVMEVSIEVFRYHNLRPVYCLKLFTYKT